MAIVRGLAANDERIVEYFRKVSYKSGGGNRVEGPFSIDIEIKESDLVDNLRLEYGKSFQDLTDAFEDAREFVRGLGLKNQSDWKTA